jgi:hypothetical protein
MQFEARGKLVAAALDVAAAGSDKAFAVRMTAHRHPGGGRVALSSCTTGIGADEITTQISIGGPTIDGSGPVRVTYDGTCGINAAAVTKICKGKKGDVIAFQADGEDRLRLSVGRATYKTERDTSTPGIAPEDASDLSEQVAPCRWHSSDFAAAWAAVRHAVSNDLGRPHLAGIGLDTTNGCLVATDGHRLFRAPCAAYSKADRDLPVCVVCHTHVHVVDKAFALFDAAPGVALHALCDDDETRGPYVTKYALTLQGAIMGCPATVMLGERAGSASPTRFPPYERAIPSYGTHAHAVVKEITSALSDVMLIAREKASTIVLEVHDARSASIRLDAFDRGEACALFPLTPRGDVAPVKVGLDASYLAEALKTFGPNETVALGYDGSNDVVTIEGAAGLAIIMPMRGV